MKHKPPIAVVLPVILAMASNFAAGAQPQGKSAAQTNNTAGGTTGTSRPYTYKSPPNAYDTVSVHTPPELPYLPPWSGKKPLFIQGLTFPRLMPRQIYTLIYQYKEPKDQVMEWYRDTLQSNNWWIQPEACTDSVITARHKEQPIDVSIQVSNGGQSGYKCTTQIRYDKHIDWKKRHK